MAVLLLYLCLQRRVLRLPPLAAEASAPLSE